MKKAQIYHPSPYETPQLSVVVPVFNEAGNLPSLLEGLSKQRGLEFEVVFCDGGSTDGSVDLLRGMAPHHPFPLRLVTAEKGRARQLNAGAAAARGEFLLFLHADSHFSDPQALVSGLTALRETIRARGCRQIAGHFRLRFLREGSAPSLPYYYYECKARLDRPGCTHGDQGFLMHRAFFETLGPFDETLPILEDTKMAESVRRKGRWLLLPADILTSARRFEVEGLRERQTLNALIMNFSAIGWEDFFRAVPGLYRSQDRIGRLRLFPIFRKIAELLRPLPMSERFSLWYRTGCYVRPQAWQIAFFFDARRNFRRGIPAGEGAVSSLQRFERWYTRATDHPPGRLVATALVWLWFLQAGFRFRIREGAGSSFVPEEGDRSLQGPSNNP